MASAEPGSLAAQFLVVRWRAQPDDTVGGWCLTMADDPRSPAHGAWAFGAFLSEPLARHMAEVHNRSLEDD